MQEKPKVLDRKTKKALSEVRQKATSVVNKFPQNRIRDSGGILLGPGAEPSEQVFKLIKELSDGSEPE